MRVSLRSTHGSSPRLPERRDLAASVVAESGLPLPGYRASTSRAGFSPSAGVSTDRRGCGCLRCVRAARAFWRRAERAFRCAARASQPERHDEGGLEAFPVSQFPVSTGQGIGTYSPVTASRVAIGLSGKKRDNAVPYHVERTRREGTPGAESSNILHEFTSFSGMMKNRIPFEPEINVEKGFMPRKSREVADKTSRIDELTMFFSYSE